MAAKRARKPATRAPRGTGTVFFNETKQRWVGRAQVGRKPNGKPLYREVWAKTQGEVVRRMRAAEPPGPDTTVAAWAERWLTSLTNRKQSAKSYEERLRHVLPVLGPLRVTAVTPVDVERLSAKLLGTLAKSTTSNVLAVAGIMFRAAVRARLIPVSPVADARKPKVPKTKREVLHPADLVRVIGAGVGCTASGATALMAGCGCRIGEAVALEVSDFDPAAGTISITKTHVSKFGTTGPPKSENGTRTITVPAAVLPVLVAAVAGRTTGPLFRSNRGNGFRPCSVDVATRRVLRGLGLPVSGSHLLRHSVASALVAAGESVADVAKYLGDSVETIVRTYLHPTGANPAHTLDRLYGGRKVGGAREAAPKTG
jgi:integrase